MPFYLLDATGQYVFLYPNHLFDERTVEVGDAWDDNVLRLADTITRSECGRVNDELNDSKGCRFPGQTTTAKPGRANPFGEDAA